MIRLYTCRSLILRTIQQAWGDYPHFIKRKLRLAYVCAGYFGWMCTRNELQRTNSVCKCIKHFLCLMADPLGFISCLFHHHWFYSSCSSYNLSELHLKSITKASRFLHQGLCLDTLGLRDCWNRSALGQVQARSAEVGSGQCLMGQIFDQWSQ